MAIPPIDMSKVKPKYEVHPFEGKRTRKVYTYEKESFGDKVILKRSESEEEIEEKAYEVFTSRGDSLVVSESELIRMGLNKPASLIDEESGEEVALPQIGSLKQRALSRVSNRSR